jgi:hypothetical protein
MKITARIKGENQKLLDDLKAGNIACRLVRNAIIIDLPLLSNNTYGIPDLLLDHKVNYFIECTENVSNRKDDVTLVCDKAGHPMRPYYISKNTEDFQNAYFAVPFCITVNVNSLNVLTLTECILHEHVTIGIKRRELYRDTIENLPDALKRFRKVIDTAFEKLHASNPNTAFYVQVDKEITIIN